MSLVGRKGGRMSRVQEGKILVVTLSNIGDVVLTLPVFGALARAYPRTRIDVIVGEAAKPVIESCPGLGRITVMDRRSGIGGRLSLLRQVRAERYDLIVDLRRSYIGLFGGAEKRNSYNLLGGLPRHRAERHLAALRGILSEDEIERGGGWGPFGSASLPEAVRRELDAGQRYVVAAPGSKSDTKKWPATNYAAVLRRLAAEGYGIVLVGDEADRRDVDSVKLHLGVRVFDLCGQLSFIELGPVVSGAALVITNDSAPLHLAESVGVPVLALFGPTDPGKYGPRRPGSVTLYRGLACSPCEKAQCRYGTRECLISIGADEATSAALRILSSAPDRKGPRILAVRLDRIGDVVLSLPALSELRRRYPDAHITVMTRPATRPLLEGHPDINDVLEYDYAKGGRHGSVAGNLRFILEVRRRRYDMAVILNPSLRSHLVPLAAGIPYRVGLGWGPAFLRTVSVRDERSAGRKHEAELTLGILAPLGAASTTTAIPRLRIFDDEMEEARLWLAREVPGQEPLLVVHPGASCPSKRWAPERFVETIGRVRAVRPCRVLIVGGREEVGLSSSIAARIDPVRVDLSGQLGLRRLAAVLACADVLLTNDSGPGHIAAAVGTPVVTIFGRKKPGLAPKRWRTLGPRDVYLHKDIGCASCPAHLCPIGFECLDAVSAADAAAAVLGLLARPAVPAGSSEKGAV